jgi:hypothetical protein
MLESNEFVKWSVNNFKFVVQLFFFAFLCCMCVCVCALCCFVLLNAVYGARENLHNGFIRKKTMKKKMKTGIFPYLNNGVYLCALIPQCTFMDDGDEKWVLFESKRIVYSSDNSKKSD